MKSVPSRLAFWALAAVLQYASSASATLVSSTNYGDELAGGLITVHYSAIFGTTPLETGSATYTLLGNPLTHAAFAPIDPNFTFFVTGETSSVSWRLVNTTAPAADPFAVYISKVEIDLRPSRGGIEPSLFDDDSSPSTPLSLEGVLGIIPDAASTGPAPTSAVESLPWTNASNLGDMYGKETLTWTGLAMLGPGENFYWHDDTDLVVPEPATCSLLALGGLALIGLFRAQRHSRGKKGSE